MSATYCPYWGVKPFYPKRRDQLKPLGSGANPKTTCGFGAFGHYTTNVSPKCFPDPNQYEAPIVLENQGKIRSFRHHKNIDRIGGVNLSICLYKPLSLVILIYTAPKSIEDNKAKYQQHKARYPRGRKQSISGDYLHYAWGHQLT